MAITTTETVRTRRLPGPTLVLGAFALTTLLNILFEAGAVVFQDGDPYRPEGPVDSIVGIAIFGGLALIVALSVALPCSKTPARARIGAIVLGVLSLLTLVIFWSGAPATLGAAAAWLAGFGRGSAPQTGAARGFGIAGFVLAILTVVATLAGHAAVYFGGQ